MKYNKTLALIPAMLLAACGGEEQAMNEPATPGLVFYSYPADGQAGISPAASIIVRFSHAISDEEADLQQKILVTDGTSPVAFTVTKVDGGQSLKLTPATELTTGTDYSVTFTDPLLAEGAREITTPNAHGAEGIQFSTRGGFTGIAGLDNMTPEFAVAELVPSPDNQFQPMNFSTFRLTLTQPVHPEWKAMGGQIRLEDAAGETVPATVLVDGRRITVDPCTVEEQAMCGTKADALTAGKTYTLRIQGLPSHTGSGALDFSQEFTPRETSPTVVLYQEVIGSGLLAGSGESGAQTSVLNGQIINGVTLNSVLQGVAGPSQQTGGLFAELAYAPSFAADEPLPLRIPKGSILTSSSLDVKINGTVPIMDARTGQLQTTGDINVTMLSDATGYLSPNPYTDDLSAPRHVKLFMDVAMNTEEAQPNASLSQDLLGVELSGIAIVKEGVLTIDAIGVVEPELLGQEYTDSTIAFRIEAATDADSALDAEQLRTPDTTSPQLVSWMPGPADAIPATRQSMQRPGDPVILNFDEPLDPESVPYGVTLFEDGVQLEDVDSKLDGTAIVLNPAGGLRHGSEYTIQVDGLIDLAGNPASTRSLQFELEPIENEAAPVTQSSPFALTTYPGYPCVTEGRQLADDKHGYCIDKLSEEGSELPKDNDGNPQTRDILPVTTIPADRPITVVFSQSMDLETIRKNDTFIVQKVDEDESVLAEISGRLEKNNQRIRFYPDTPWEAGSLYRYTMVSAKNGDCTTVICGENGMALQTDLLLDPTDNGGQPLAIYFRGTTATDTVFTPLRNLPIRDTNSNFIVDEAIEPFNAVAEETDPDGNVLSYASPANAAKLLMKSNAVVLGNDGGSEANARVGCSYEGEECPDEKFIYQTYGLNTEIIGPEIDPVTGEPTGNIRVLLYPTMLVTTSATVWYNLLGPSESVTGPQILRMRYGQPTEDNPMGLVEGLIVENDNGRPEFRTEAELMLDAPNLHLPLGDLLAHNLFSYPFTLNLRGEITFFDDGRMQIEQRNTNTPFITVDVAGSSDGATGLVGFISCLGGIFTGGGLDACEDLANENGKAVQLPLKIPPQGVYLNFISNPVKEIPAQQ
ncbi:Ig-like domain-containing domain [Marinobacter sp. F4206]|uniref:Ig-like domain-containing protein n=1 Tax=Marinobacter sp. F4206 TaxID=2861777 RepID=UPI001C5EA3DB|nr:Ig-like domain-containing protein [Marinobacter sp. F4206]MBW4935541.1 Ig-like domain-containing protein [Marinobacter sp. F4206]